PRPHHERPGLVVGGELRAERHDQVVVAGLGLLLFEVDAEHRHVGSLVLEPPADRARRGGALVLDHQRAEPGRPGAHRSRPRPGAAVARTASCDSTSSATWRTDSASRATISGSSSSVVVNGGANNVWSPA